MRGTLSILNLVNLILEVPRHARGIVVSMALALLGALSPFVASASEGGGLGNYGVGALTLGSAFAPPEGTTNLGGYLLYYSADKFRDGSGKGNIVPGFNLNFVAMATVLKHTWNFKIAGLNVTSGLIHLASHVDVDAGGQSDTATGNWTAGIQPLILTGKSGKLHYLMGTYVFFPIGDYDPNALANASLNYFSYSQELSFTWLPSPQWMLDLSSNISINGSNHDTDYRSGDYFAVTYGAQYRVPAAPKWQVGVSGLYFNQHQDDKLNGNKIDGGFRLRKITGGPQITYWFSPAIVVLAKWHHEFEVRNGPQGDQFWLQASIPIL